MAGVAAGVTAPLAGPAGRTIMSSMVQERASPFRKGSQAGGPVAVASVRSALDGSQYDEPGVARGDLAIAEESAQLRVVAEMPVADHPQLAAAA